MAGMNNSLITDALYELRKASANAPRLGQVHYSDNSIQGNTQNADMHTHGSQKPTTSFGSESRLLNESIQRHAPSISTTLAQPSAAQPAPQPAAQPAPQQSNQGALSSIGYGDRRDTKPYHSFEQDLRQRGGLPSQQPNNQFSQIGGRDNYAGIDWSGGTRGMPQGGGALQQALQAQERRIPSLRNPYVDRDNGMAKELYNQIVDGLRTNMPGQRLTADGLQVLTQAYKAATDNLNQYNFKDYEALSKSLDNHYNNISQLYNTNLSGENQRDFAHIQGQYNLQNTQLGEQLRGQNAQDTNRLSALMDAWKAGQTGEIDKNAAMAGHYRGMENLHNMQAETGYGDSTARQYEHTARGDSLKAQAEQLQRVNIKLPERPANALSGLDTPQSAMHDKAMGILLPIINAGLGEGGLTQQGFMANVQKRLATMQEDDARMSATNRKHTPIFDKDTLNYIQQMMLHLGQQLPAHSGMAEGGLVYDDTEYFADGGMVPEMPGMPPDPSLDPTAIPQGDPGMASGAMQGYQEYMELAQKLGLPPISFEEFMTMQQQGQQQQAAAMGSPPAPEMQQGAQASNAVLGLGGGAVGAPPEGYAGGGQIPGMGALSQIAGGPQVDGKMVIDPDPGAGTDSIPAMIDGHRPAALDSGEMVIPKDVVMHFGTKTFQRMIDEVMQPKQSKAQPA